MSSPSPFQPELPFPPLSLNEYQKLAATTAMYPDKGKGNHNGINYTLLGLVGESGELANKWKKCLRGDSSADLTTTKEALRWELGDALWYVANLAAELGMTMEQVAQANLDKLKDRKSRNKIQGSGDHR